MLRVVASIAIAFAVLLVVASQYEKVPALAVTELGAPAHETRLIVLWIDSLAREDVESGKHLPILRSHLPSALHGPVRECADAVSVPCLNAMTTGIDRFSLGALWADHGGATGLPAGSLLASLSARGLRIGVAADPKVTPAVRGLHWVYDEAIVDDAHMLQVALAALERESLDLIIIQLRELDQISHKRKPASAEYVASLAKVDRQIEEVRNGLRPSDHFVVLGDHGHDALGRHFAGLDVPSYAAFWGQTFARPHVQPMAMTDHASLWGRVFGLKVGSVPWIESYFGGGVLPAATKLPELKTSAAPMSLTLVALSLLGALCVMLLPGKPIRGGTYRWVAVCLVVVIGAALLGLTFVDYRALLYAKPYVRTTLTSLLWGVPFALAARVALGQHSGALPWWVLWTGAVFLLSPPTVYRFGGFVASTSAFLLSVILYAAVLAKDRKRETAFRALGFALAFTTIWVAYVSNFKLAFFTFYSMLLGTAQWAAVALALGVFWWLVRQRAERTRTVDLAFGVGLALSALVPWSNAFVYVLPCVLAAPLLLIANRKQSFAPAALALALPAYAFFLGASDARIAPLACALVLFPLWGTLSGNLTPSFRALGVVALLWSVYWTAFGCRVSGFDFTYFYKWLAPSSPVEDTWLENALLTTSLYIGLPLLGLLAYELSRPPEEKGARTLRQATLWTHAKLGAVLSFLVGYAARGASIGAAVTTDLVMESALWLIAALVLLLVQSVRGSDHGSAALPYLSAGSNPRSSLDGGAAARG